MLSDDQQPQSSSAKQQEGSGLPEQEPKGWDKGLQAKLAQFHELKKQGTHFNHSLQRNRAFNNPDIYTKLVQFVELDETASNFPDYTPKATWCVPTVDAAWIADQQRRQAEQLEEQQKRGKRSRIEFTRQR